MGRRSKGLVALFGLVMFMGALALLVSSGISFPFPGESSAAGGGGDGELPPCLWEVSGAVVGEVPEQGIDADPVDLDNIVMKQSDNLALIVKATPFEGDEECSGTLSADAPSFNISPSEAFTASATSQRPAIAALIFAPNTTGRLMFSVSSFGTTFFELYDVSVTNSMGIGPGLSQTFTLLGTVFGPILTLPWWLDWIRERRKERTTAETEQEEPSEENQ